MKRLVLMTLAIMLLIPGVVLAAGSWAAPAYNSVSSSSNFKTVTFSWTADAANGTVPNYTIPSAALEFMKGYFLYYIVTDPSSTAPTDNYDITVLTASGLDIVGGVLADRDTANTEKTSPAGAYPALDGTALTITVSNNAVNSATGTITFVVSK